MNRLLWLTIGWTATASAAVGLYLRWTTAHGPFVIGMVGMMPLLLIPALATVSYSAYRIRSPYLRLAALSTGVIYLATFVSAGSLLGCGPEQAEDEITIYTHNTYWQQGNPAAIAATVAESDADIVVLQEVWPALRDTLTRSDALAGLSHRVDNVDDGSPGLLVWSRWPLDGSIQAIAPGRARYQASVATPNGALTVNAVHLPAPVSAERTADWSNDLRHLGELDIAGPAVMVGDFNATSDHAQFRSLLSKGWTDAHIPKGCGFDATWPKGRTIPFAFLRLDHVLVSDGIEVLAVQLGDENGSDHRPVVASIRLGPQAQAGGSP